MIASISGTVGSVGEDHVVVMVGGIGFKVYITRSWLAQLKLISRSLCTLI